jgi:hypothetical protein
MLNYDWLSMIGGACFGIVVGWISYRFIRFAPIEGLADLAIVIGVVGGAAVTAISHSSTGAFGAYGIGLFVGFFAYLRTAMDPAAPPWIGGTLRPRGEDARPGKGELLAPVPTGRNRQPSANGHPTVRNGKVESDD